MNRLSHYITGLASLSFIFTVIQFEALTGLSSRWERPENRKLIEERLRINHTDKLLNQFHEEWYKANVRDVQQYSDAYLCAAKADASRCKSGRTMQVVKN